MKILFSIFFLSTLIVACGSLTPFPADSGVQGQALIGPTCPVVQIGQECPDQLYQAQFVVTRSQGGEVARFKSDADGMFKVNLPAGDYILHAENPDDNMLPYAEDISFTVTAGAFTNIIVTFDSGIR